MKDFIGVFDSGLGGITVLGDLMMMLPGENYIYFGDSLNAPYGTKTQKEIFELSRKICDMFVSKGAKAIVIACNTATSAAVNDLRDLYDIPIVGMEPALKPAVLNNNGKAIAVMATDYTLNNEKFENLRNRLSHDVVIDKIPSPGLVKLVEEGVYDGEKVDDYLSELYVIRGNDEYEAIVLGCTHFLYNREAIRSFIGDVDIYDGNEGTVVHLKHRLLEESYLSNHEKTTVEIMNSKGEEMVKLSREMLATYLRSKYEIR